MKQSKFTKKRDTIGIIGGIDSAFEVNVNCEQYDLCIQMGSDTSLLKWLSEKFKHVNFVVDDYEVYQVTMNSLATDLKNVTFINCKNSDVLHFNKDYNKKPIFFVIDNHYDHINRVVLESLDEELEILKTRDQRDIICITHIDRLDDNKILEFFGGDDHNSWDYINDVFIIYRNIDKE